MHIGVGMLLFHRERVYVCYMFVRNTKDKTVSAVRCHPVLQFFSDYLENPGLSMLFSIFKVDFVHRDKNKK